MLICTRSPGLTTRPSNPQSQSDKPSVMRTTCPVVRLVQTTVPTPTPNTEPPIKLGLVIIPVPTALMFKGEFWALDAKDSLVTTRPEVVGVNMTLNEQESPGTTVPVHVSGSILNAGLSELILMLLRLPVPPPVFVTVNTAGADDVPISTSPKLKKAGDAEIIGLSKQSPLRHCRFSAVCR